MDMAWKNYLLCLAIIKTKGLWHPNDEINMSLDDSSEDMVHDIVEDNFVKRLYIFYTLLHDVEKPLYPSCIKFTWLCML